ncbi:CUB and peptidase domain-containing protein 1 [Aedes albopictus]|uniref:Peptidase S1 domain-containing protein n=1 Tax=Aedes albopictus TaxID=7160 RepID=A0ABM1Y7E0_AEDAL
MAALARIVVICGVFAPLFSVKGQSNKYFTDTQPWDYYYRKTLDDCPGRFYPDPYKYVFLHVFEGKPAFKGEFKHMVAIGWTTANGNIQYLCGGALISSKFILTAAHCSVNREGYEPDTVRLGDINLAEAVDDATAQQIGIRSFRKHPEYRPSRKYFDIALIELETEAIINSATCFACIWLGKDVPQAEMQVIGFGATGYGENLSPTLQKVTLSAVDKESCSERVPVSKRQQPNGFVDGQFCAGSDHADTCEGDSGGPIQIERIDIDGSVIPLIVGVVSYGTPCSKGSLGVYTRVASYQEWIEQELQHPIDYVACTRTSTCLGRKTVDTNIHRPLYPGPIFRVGLLWDSTNFNAFECGATIIDYRFAVTSASCVQLKPIKPRSIIVETTGETVDIDEIILHPRYRADKPVHDIALLKLSKFIDPNTDVLPACLSKKDLEELNIWHQSVSAFGTRYANKESFKKDDFERYTIEMYEYEKDIQCVNPEFSSNSFYCFNNSVDFIPTVCNMDYGGPVSGRESSKNVPYLLGVVSKLSESCGEDVIVVKVKEYIDWIESVVLDHTSERLIFQ